jgi:hypothetical protein
MKLALITLVALAVAGSAAAAPRNATLTIKHQLHGCHSWSFDGHAGSATQTIKLGRGGALTVVDNDVMPHKLIQVSGPKAALAGAAMKRMGGSAHVGFPVKGTYVFKTRAGDDYAWAKNIKTRGDDNVLELVVTVV